MPSPKATKPARTKRGFQRTGQVLAPRIRAAGEARGFAVTRLLTHWPEVAGEGIARIARPVEVSYARGGFGATLTILTTGAQAPMLEMQKETLRERVNTAYGYAAISRIRITQTAATGFAEGQAHFSARPAATPSPDPQRQAAARAAAAVVTNETLRDALARLGENVLSRNRT